MSKLKIYSFGCKYNQSYKFSVVIDTRILENPYYIPEFKYLTGLDNRVYNFIINKEVTKEFINKLVCYLNFYLINIFKINNEIEIGIMCTGGRHRSVSIARFLNEYYKNLYDVSVTHLDVYHEIS